MLHFLMHNHNSNKREYLYGAAIMFRVSFFVLNKEAVRSTGPLWLDIKYGISRQLLLGTCNSSII